MDIDWKVLEINNENLSMLIEYSCSGKSINLNINVGSSANVEQTIQRFAPVQYFRDVLSTNKIDLSVYSGASGSFVPQDNQPKIIPKATP